MGATAAGIVASAGPDLLRPPASNRVGQAISGDLSPCSARRGRRAIPAALSTLARGETIAYGQKSPAGVTPSWGNAPGHRANNLPTFYPHRGRPL